MPISHKMGPPLQTCGPIHSACSMYRQGCPVHNTIQWLNSVNAMPLVKSIDIHGCAVNKAPWSPIPCRVSSGNPQKGEITMVLCLTAFLEKGQCPALQLSRDGSVCRWANPRGGTKLQKRDPIDSSSQSHKAALQTPVSFIMAAHLREISPEIPWWTGFRKYIQDNIFLVCLDTS